MPELFELEELVTLMQRPSLPADIATLARQLVTIEIRNAVGATLYDSLTDVTKFKGVALTAAKRGIRNPEGLRSTSEHIDDYEFTDTYASETVVEEIELTEAEIRKVRRLAGLSNAFSVTPSIPENACVPAASWPTYQTY